MCQKEVDLRLSQFCQSTQPPEPQEMGSIQSLSQCSGSLSMKNRAITKKERREYNSGNSVDHRACSGQQRAEIIIQEGLGSQQKEIQQTKLYSTNIQTVVGCCLQSASGSYYSFANCDTKVLFSVAQKLQGSPGTVVILLLLFGTVCSVNGTDDTFLGNGFTSSIQFNCPRPGKWLSGPTTIAKNVTNLIIDRQNMKNTYVCEVKAPNGDPALCQFPMQVFNSCSTVENEEFTEFKGGQRCIQVELEGYVAGSDSGKISQQYYSFCVKNAMLEISPEEGSGHHLQLSRITKCNIKYKNIEPNTHPNGSIQQVLNSRTANIVKDDGEKSKLVEGIVIGAGVVLLIVMCLLCTWLGITQWKTRRRRRGEAHNLDEIKPAINSA